MTTLKLITKRVTIENIPNSNVNMVTAECIALDLLLKQLPDEVLNAEINRRNSEAMNKRLDYNSIFFNNASINA